MAFVLPFLVEIESKLLLATEKDIAQDKLRFLFTAPGGIVGNSRWKQIVLELPEVTVIADEAHCVYKIMCPHTLSADSLHERLHHCHILRRIIPKINGSFCTCTRSSPQAFSSSPEWPGNEASCVLALKLWDTNDCCNLPGLLEA